MGNFFSIGLGIYVYTCRSILPANFSGAQIWFYISVSFGIFYRHMTPKSSLVEVISSNVLGSPSWLGLIVSKYLCYKWQLICFRVNVMTWFNRFRMSVLQMTIDMFMTWFNRFRISVLQMTIDMFLTWFNRFRMSVTNDNWYVHDLV